MIDVEIGDIVAVTKRYDAFSEHTLLSVIRVGRKYIYVGDNVSFNPAKYDRSDGRLCSTHGWGERIFPSLDALLSERIRLENVSWIKRILDKKDSITLQQSIDILKILGR